MNTYKNITDKMYMSMIVCADENWGIGNHGNLLFKFPADMQNFVKFTKNKTLIMGHKTFKSFGLKHGLTGYGRKNIVLSKSVSVEEIADTEQSDQLQYFESIDSLFYYIDQKMEKMTDDEKREYYNRFVVIGGASIYKQFLQNNLIDEIRLTRIYHTFPADAFIPDLYELGFERTFHIDNGLVPCTDFTYDIDVLIKYY